MEILLLLATLGPTCALIGLSVGANVGYSPAMNILLKLFAAFAVTVLIWMIWPTYAERFSLPKHLLVFAVIFYAGFLGGKAQRKASKAAQAQRK
jgi:uncharacterized membrane protein YfcA